jgi:hypothetical protein
LFAVYFGCGMCGGGRLKLHIAEATMGVVLK